MRRGKRIAIIAGIGAVLLVGGITGNYWKEMYFVLYPEARFWGRWEISGTDGISSAGETPKIIFEFRKNGETVFDLAGVPPTGLERWARQSGPTYRVNRNLEVTFQIEGSARTVTARYRFGTEGVLTIEFENEPIFGGTMTLRRLPES